MRDVEAELSEALVAVGVSSGRAAVAEALVRKAASGQAVRLGILGGTFDPIHFGHLYAAEQARQKASLDAVLVMPAGEPAFKQGERVSDAADRLAMCRLAVHDNPHFAASDLEVARPGVTHTSETLRQVREALPQVVSICFIVGADALASLRTWHESDRIAQLARIVAVSRPGCRVPVRQRDALAREGFRVTYVEAPSLPISSTAIREAAARGESVRYLTPLPVCDYLAQKGLYRAASA